MSLYNMKPNQIITSSNFVKEPVKIITEEINRSANKKIILPGPIGGGKSIVLKALEQERWNTGHDAVYMPLDATINASYLTDKEQYYRCEYFFCFELYRYIEEKYPTIYQEKFKDDHQILRNIKNVYLTHINNNSIESFL